MKLRRKLLISSLAGLTFAVLAVFAVRAFAETVLQAAGWVLVVEEPVRQSDIIVISPDARGAGALEAADLVQSGVASRVAVFNDPPSGEDFEFIRRGLPYEDAGAVQVRQLTALGVVDIVQISRVDGTESGVVSLQKWCEEQHIKSVVMVTSKDHTRRLQRLLDRAMKGRPISVTVRGARYSTFDPDRWWMSRAGVRTEVLELQKLILDLLRHPALS